MFLFPSYKLLFQGTAEERQKASVPPNDDFYPNFYATAYKSGSIMKILDGKNLKNLVENTGSQIQELQCFRTNTVHKPIHCGTSLLKFSIFQSNQLLPNNNF